MEHALGEGAGDEIADGVEHGEWGEEGWGGAGGRVHAVEGEGGAGAGFDAEDDGGAHGDAVGSDVHGEVEELLNVGVEECAGDAVGDADLEAMGAEVDGFAGLAEGEPEEEEPECEELEGDEGGEPPGE